MKKFEFLNNYADAVCVFSDDGKVVFKNSIFKSLFADIKSIERFKNRFSSDLSILSSDKVKYYSPIDMLLEAKENFHTICSYQNSDGEFSYYYIYSFNLFDDKAVVFKDVTAEDTLNSYKTRYSNLELKYFKTKEATDKYSKLQENAQTQVLKMGIINRISLVIRETNDISQILSSALKEIQNLTGAFKIYFSEKHGTGFKILKDTIDEKETGKIFTYEKDLTEKIKNKEITAAPCIKEYVEATQVFSSGVTRIIIPVYSKNKLLGIISLFTRQRVSIEENIEIFQSVSVQLASSIIQSKLINQLNQKNKKLEKTLNELKGTQLQLINSEKMASLGQLISGVAHEINTPLASISSNNNLINKILSCDGDLPADKISMLKDLNSIDIEASERIANIVKSLKRFVRLDEAEFQKANINSELDLTLKLIVHETKNHINIVKNYSDVPEILCSANMLNQVFMNLLINACHSIKDSKGSGEITISTSVCDNNLVVKIKDNGGGIPFKIQSKIFNVGFTTKKSGMGTGLGLSISKKIIEMHKGTISFKTKEGQGSEFTVSIPYVNEIHA